MFSFCTIRKAHPKSIQVKQNEEMIGCLLLSGMDGVDIFSENNVALKLVAVLIQVRVQLVAVSKGGHSYILSLSYLMNAYYIRSPNCSLFVDFFLTLSLSHLQ
jgi:hypothetical protein